ncbi:MAG: outer membrane protein assembly factor BamD [Polyangiaceae bacterium]
MRDRGTRRFPLPNVGWTVRPVVRMATLSLALAAGPLGASGCLDKPASTGLNYSADAKRAYEAAMEEFDSHNWLDAQALFREVKRKYSYSKWARLAELRIADADFEQDKFAEATRGYRQFVHDHRSDTDDVVYARSRIAEAQYREISDSLFLPPGEERDQAVVVDAYRELRGFLHDYPDAKESARVKKLVADVTAKLIRHELYVAKFYLNVDNYEAAVARVQYALRNYAAPGTIADALDAQSGLEAEALLLLGETYLKMHHWTDARASFNEIKARYPQSGLTVQAEKYLAYMQKRGV